MRRIIEIQGWIIDRAEIAGVSPLWKRTEFNFTVLSFQVCLQGQILKFEEKFVTALITNDKSEREEYQKFREDYFEFQQSIKKSIAARRTTTKK